MKTLLTSEKFQTELPGWALRGVLCAANSAFWAWMMGFQQPEEIAGMVAGLAFWVAVFAGLCATTPLLERLKQPQFGAALKRAAWIKIALTAVGWLAFVGASLVRTSGAEALAVFGMADVFLGMAALWLVSRAAGVSDLDQIGRLDSFGWTALTTIVEGALMAVAISAIALVVLGWWRWGGLDRVRKLLSPVPNVD
jgi:hypothetical protein